MFLDILASCVMFFIWLEILALIIYMTVMLWHAHKTTVLLVTSGNRCNLLCSFMSNVEHIKSKVHILCYLTASFRMCFWNLTGICEKQRPGCLGKYYYYFYSQLHQNSCAGCSVWFIQAFEVPGITAFFLAILHDTLGSYLWRILPLVSRTGLSEMVVFGCLESILQISARIYIRLMIRSENGTFVF